MRKYLVKPQSQPAGGCWEGGGGVRLRVQTVIPTVASGNTRVYPGACVCVWQRVDEDGCVCV